MKNQLIFICISVLLASCSGKNQTKKSDDRLEVEVIKVDFSKEFTDRKFPETNYSMGVLRLEDNEDFPIGYVDKIIMDNNRIYILDRSKSKSLFIYSRDGKFIDVINRIGNGPGEFTVPQDFSVDKNNGHIIIMDNNSSKFIFYSLDGEYVKQWQYDLLGVSFVLDGEHIIMDNGNIPTKDGAYYLRKFDLDGNVVSNLFPSDPSSIGITLNPRFALQQNSDKLYFLPSLSNFIYTLDGEEPVPAYQIDFGKDWPSQGFFEGLRTVHPLDIRQKMFDNNYVCFLNFMQTDDVLHIDFYKDKPYSFYYHKETKKSLLLPMEDESVSYPLATNGNEFVFVKYGGKWPVAVVTYTVDFDLDGR